MATSQNGWPANDANVIAAYTVPGSKVKVALRRGDVSVILLHLAAWFNANVEQLRQSDTGGYNPRPIRGSETTSNHASGTAIDMRWNDHPLSAVNTFTDAQEQVIRAQLKRYEGVVRWGGDYRGRKDEMHWEINKGTAETRRIADKLRAQARQQEDGMATPEETRTIVREELAAFGRRDPLATLYARSGEQQARMAAVPAQFAAIASAVAELVPQDIDEDALAAALAERLPQHADDITPEELRVAIVGAARDLFGQAA